MTIKPKWEPVSLETPTEVLRQLRSTAAEMASTAEGLEFTDASRAFQDRWRELKNLMERQQTDTLQSRPS